MGRVHGHMATAIWTIWHGVASILRGWARYGDIQRVRFCAGAVRVPLARATRHEWIHPHHEEDVGDGCSRASRTHAHGRWLHARARPRLWVGGRGECGGAVGWTISTISRSCLRRRRQYRIDQTVMSLLFMQSISILSSNNNNDLD